MDGLGGFERIINDLDKLYSKDLSLKQCSLNHFN